MKEGLDVARNKVEALTAKVGDANGITFFSINLGFAYKQWNQSTYNTFAKSLSRWLCFGVSDVGLISWLRFLFYTYHVIDMHLFLP